MTMLKANSATKITHGISSSFLAINLGHWENRKKKTRSSFLISTSYKFCKTRVACSQTLFVLFKARQARMRRTKRKIKQRLCTG